MVINMPMLFLIAELDFSWPLFTAGYTGWRSDYTVAGTANEFYTNSPLTYSVQCLIIVFKIKCK